MTRFWISLGIGAAALNLLLAATPAKAIVITFVSSHTGSGANTCTTPATPCGTIASALSKTEPGGEIKCLDNHVDSLLTINKPITIDCGAPGSLIEGFGGIPAIIVDLDEATYPNGVVTLRNLTINGLLGTSSPGADGIRVIGGGKAVHIENCSIQGSAEQGIDFTPTSSVDLFVRDTVITNSAGGILIAGTATSGAVSAALRNSVVSGNSGFGLRADESGAGTANVMLESSTSSNNGTNGVVAVGSNAIIRMRNSTSTGNAAKGLVALSGGQIVSHGGNVVAGNTANGAFTGTFAQQ